MGNLNMLGGTVVQCKADNGMIIDDMYWGAKTMGNSAFLNSTYKGKMRSYMASQNIDVRYWLSVDGINLAPWIAQYENVMSDKELKQFINDLHCGGIGKTIDTLYRMLFQAKKAYTQMEPQLRNSKEQYQDAIEQLEKMKKRVAELEKQVGGKINPPAQKYNLDVNEIYNMRKSMSVSKIAEVHHCSKRTIYNALAKGMDIEQNR